ncbi:MAG: tRNA pseudouridine(38-40) synthase TruA [Candidatus Omnitrophica bacterium]|nr:tRNA pseudouridine(38-40) synthase TruA [Candidatus Omnitrophota bacterium]
MHNIRLTIEYEGTKYCGWQRQRIKRTDSKYKKQKISIQETIESCLKKILKQKVCLIASGRTDSGVHAFGQVANFKTSSKIEPHKLKLALNGNLPKDIRISKVEKVPLGFHSRYSTKSKIYRYFILNQDYKSSFLEGYSYWFKFPLDINLMEKASKSLLGRYDFKVFCASGSSVKDTTRTIKRISITKLNFFSCNLFCIEIEADGFLYNMVRNIVGTLIEIGRGRFAPTYIKKIIKCKDRSLAGPCVPAKGLYLIKVKY